MNKDDIKKALAYCASDSIDDCKNCPYTDNGPFACSISMYKDARTLIIEQEKEIKQLTEERNRYAETLAKYQMASDKEIRAQKKQAVKEFAEKLKEKALLHCRTINCYECKFIETTIDELLEERK